LAFPRLLRHIKHYGDQAYALRARTIHLHILIWPELYHVIADEAPDAVKNGEIKNHFGRKVAIVSTSIICKEII
jgi:hypothetical protein